MTNMVFRERILINSMLSVAPNIVFAPNITQNAERKQRTQNTNTAHNRLQTNAGLGYARLTTYTQRRKAESPTKDVLYPAVDGKQC